ncbi:MAG: ABC transporter ATP-binding protein [Eubacteriales bacterium]|nr:ABC transporter ATP-binding protein [Eubacteriales bacterium]
MDTNTVIEVENLSKCYKLYDKPSARLKEIMLGFSNVQYKEHYAVDGLSFSVTKGETFGIIGDNGAGKSTLLKLITGVTQPTSGSMLVRGKVSALLELGAGFNKEYTGIENIYLNGSMMGIDKHEMAEKAKEILDFADIGEYAYQKVKTYSSGMFARLAFSVAINVKPEILIVDEALSVGDVFFQNKCFKKFEELRKKGVTILFVSHDIATVRQMCSRVLWLEAGKLRMIGDSVSVCNAYTNSIYERTPEAIINELERKNDNEYGINYLSIKDYPEIHYTEESILNDDVQIVSCYIVDENHKVVTECKVNKEYIFNMVFQSKRKIAQCMAGFVLETKKGVWLINVNSGMCGKKTSVSVEKDSINKVTFKFRMPAFMRGEHVVGFALAEGTMENYKILTWLYNVLAITIVNEGNNSGMVDVDAEIKWYRNGKE